MGGLFFEWPNYGNRFVEKRLALNPRVKVFQGSQDNPIFLRKVCDERGPFDIVIDDGSHVPKHVVTSFHILFPSLVNGGIYLIEDVQTAFWPRFGGSMLHGGDTVKLARMVIECLKQSGITVADRSHSFPSFAKQIKAFRAFHNVFVIDKGDNCEPSDFAYDLNNPHAVSAVKMIEQELESSPTAEGMANLIDVYLRWGNLVRAKEIADRALSLWPANVRALVAAYSAAMRRKDTPAKLNYLERILQIEPDNTGMQRAIEQARAEFKQLDPGSQE